MIKTIQLVCAASVLALAVTGCSSNTETPSQYSDKPAAPAAKKSTSTSTTSTQGGIVTRTISLPSTNASTDPLVITRKAPASVNIGQTYTYEMTVSNRSDFTLRDITLVETLGDGFEYASSSPSGTKDGSKVSWVIPALNPGQATTITVTGKADSTATKIHDCVTATFTPCACLLTEVLEAKLALTKVAIVTSAPAPTAGTAGPIALLSCDTAKYVYTVTNPGTGVAKDVVISDTLPAGIKTADGSNNVSVKVGDLASGASKAYEVAVTFTGNGEFGSTATATSGGLKVDATAPAFVVTTPMLEITNSGPKAIPLGHTDGATITYALSVKNTGTGDARKTIVTDTVPAGSSIAETPAGASVSGSTITWDVGTLAAGQSKDFTAKVRIPATAGQLNNHAEATAYCAKAVAADSTTVVQGIPALLLEMVDSEDPIRVGSTIEYIITITNQGTSRATNIQVTGMLEDCSQFLDSSGVTAGAHEAGKITFSPVAVLEPKGKISWKIHAKALKEASSIFSTTVKCDEIPRVVDKTESTTLYK